MKKFFATVLSAVMLFSMAACSPAASAAPSAAPAGESSAAPAETSAEPAETPAMPAESAEPAQEPDPNASAETFELALVTDMGSIDDKSFNQGSWEGLKQYADEKGLTYKYYQPTEASTDALLTGIDLAVKGGAKVVVTPGFLFVDPIASAQETYPDVKFIIVDDQPAGGPKENTIALGFAEYQPGFLAGYASVKEGYRKLGFMGGVAVPAVMNYGYGFVQGAEFAANELGLGEGEVTVNYHYTGGFEATPEAQAMAASWYNNGVEVIFGCGGTVGNSVMTAAEAAGKFVIGVDADQSGVSDTVITSAMKEIKSSVYSSVKGLYEGTTPGAQHLIANAENGGIGLPMATSKFENFTQADYDAIYEQLKSNSITLVDYQGTFESMNLTYTTVTEVK